MQFQRNGERPTGQHNAFPNYVQMTATAMLNMDPTQTGSTASDIYKWIHQNFKTSSLLEIKHNVDLELGKGTCFMPVGMKSNIMLWAIKPHFLTDFMQGNYHTDTIDGQHHLRERPMRKRPRIDTEPQAIFYQNNFQHQTTVFPNHFQHQSSFYPNYFQSQSTLYPNHFQHQTQFQYNNVQHQMSFSPNNIHFQTGFKPTHIPYHTILNTSNRPALCDNIIHYQNNLLANSVAQYKPAVDDNYGTSNDEMPHATNAAMREKTNDTTNTVNPIHHQQNLIANSIEQTKTSVNHNYGTCNDTFLNNSIKTIKNATNAVMSKTTNNTTKTHTKQINIQVKMTNSSTYQATNSATKTTIKNTGHDNPTNINPIAQDTTNISLPRASFSEHDDDNQAKNTDTTTNQSTNDATETTVERNENDNANNVNQTACKTTNPGQKGLPVTSCSDHDGDNQATRIDTTANQSTHDATETTNENNGIHETNNINQTANDTTKTGPKTLPKIRFSDGDGNNDSDNDEEVADTKNSTKKESFIKLNSQQQQEVSRALAPGQTSQLIVKAHNISITKEDIQTLRNGAWLNDEIINFYLNMLVERYKNNNKNASIHAFNSFFYPKLLREGHKGVRRWSKKFNVFGCHLILIPVHLGIHWCLAVMDTKKKEITYYDSLGVSNNKCLQALKQYMVDESQTKNVNFNELEWKLLNKKDIPRQRNGYDCGVFACKFAEYITREEQFNFSQDHMEYFRQRMVYEIMHNCLL